MKKTKVFPANPIRIQDNTLRDGHQSIYATRMKTEDMIPIAEKMDQCGFWAMEVWVAQLLTRCTGFWAKTPGRGQGFSRNM